MYRIEKTGLQGWIINCFWKIIFLFPMEKNHSTAIIEFLHSTSYQNFDTISSNPNYNFRSWLSLTSGELARNFRPCAEQFQIREHS